MGLLHTQAHKHIQAHTHTDGHTHIHMHTYTHVHMQHAHTYIHTHAYTHTCARKHACTLVPAHTRTYTRLHTHTDSHTCLSHLLSSPRCSSPAVCLHLLLVQKGHCNGQEERRQCKTVTINTPADTVTKNTHADWSIRTVSIVKCPATLAVVHAYTPLFPPLCTKLILSVSIYV